MITCRVCERKVPALEGARCSRCRRLVCAACLAPAEVRVCRDCAAEPEPTAPAAPPEEVARPAGSGPGRARGRRPQIRRETAAGLIAVLAAGLVLALLALAPSWRARSAIRRLGAAEGDRIEALAPRLERAARGAPATFAGALGALPPQKRCAAIRALGRAGRMSAVPYLIRELEEGEMDVRAAAGQALWEVTGEDLGPDPDAWRNWWRDRE